MKKNIAIPAALWLSMAVAFSTMADPVKKPDGTTVAEPSKETPSGNPTKPATKSEVKPDAGTAKKQGPINTEAELETDCNNQ